MMRVLLEHKIDTETKDECECTALHYASSCFSIECISVLLLANANIEAINVFGNRPIHFAVWDPKSLDILLKKGANKNAKNCNGHTVLDVANHRGDSLLRESIDLLKNYV